MENNEQYYENIHYFVNALGSFLTENEAVIQKILAYDDLYTMANTLVKDNPVDDDNLYYLAITSDKQKFFLLRPDLLENNKNDN